MAATPIATLNKTTHVSLLRILSLRFFRFHLVHLASPSGDARTRSGTLAGAVKGQGADSWPSLYLPLNAVICRGLETVRGLQFELPGFATAEQIRRARWANPSQAHSHLQDPQKTGSIPGRKSRCTSTAT